MNDTLLKALEALLNRRIAASTPARSRLAELEGRVLALTFRDTPLAIYIVAEGGRLRLAGRYAEDPDAVLSGSPLALAALASPDGGRALGGRVSLEGDADTARRFQGLLEHARPDWEEELSRLVGDMAAHQMGNLVRGVARWGQEAARRLTADVTEFLQEESRQVPAREEVEIFRSEVAALRARLARAEARLARLEQ